ncbi:hypothetical protein [Streptomyces sp. NBC_01304]|uniref:hypothetical protein n=1 Tax=Streptomyces sp. NBC_01304 TaxID=2903818 RepID=UPI002E126241|nr:hypothetical protein OG430_25985 [Streptomyces sp. NBC_01304]
MKCIVAGHVAVTAREFAELALGFDWELFAGPKREGKFERMARLDVARDVLAGLRVTDPEAAAIAEALLRGAPLAPRRPVRRSTRRAPARRVRGCESGTGVAA